MDFDMGKYISALLAPLFYGFGLYGEASQKTDKESKLEKSARKIPPMKSTDPKRVQYTQRTVSRMGGQKGRS